MPTSSQLRNALAYMSITVLVLVFLNIYSARATRDLMFKAKCSSSQDKLKVVTSSIPRRRLSWANLKTSKWLWR